jgi:hypothetical protein
LLGSYIVLPPGPIAVAGDPKERLEGGGFEE